ncbi:MAG: hypothetical protein GPJ20_21255 [Microcystis aeruginosa BS13-10]|nr:hypothetical protein [Microcystis aeruginosa BS13-10]
MGNRGDCLLCLCQHISSDYAYWYSSDSTSESGGGYHGSSRIVRRGTFCRSMRVSEKMRGGQAVSG